MSNYLTRTEAARCIGISPKQLGNYIRQGLLMEVPGQGLAPADVLAFRGPYAWDTLLSPLEVAKLLQVSIATVHLYRRQGRIAPAYTTPTGYHLYRQEDIDALAPTAELRSDKDAALYLGIPLKRLRAMAIAGKVPHSSTPSGRRRYRQADLDALKAS